jgi:hypothetical protein
VFRLPAGRERLGRGRALIRHGGPGIVRVMASGRSVRRKALLACGAIVAILLLPLPILIAVALVAPYTSAPIPTSCEQQAAHLPTDRAATVPRIGPGTLLAGDGRTSVIVVPDPTTGPPIGTAYIVDAQGDRVVWSLRLASHAVVAAISDGIVYVFDDKIGYLVKASTGDPVPKVFETDNYRGLYVSGGERVLQTDAEISWVALGGAVFSYRHLDFAGIAYGCFVGD